MVAPPTALSRRSFMLLIQLSPSDSINMMGHTAFETQQNHLVLLSSLHGGEVSSFPGSSPSSDMVNSESVVGI